MNLLTLILQAGPVAKVVMVLLLAISVGAWAVIWFKWQELRRTESLLYELSKTIEHAEDSVSLAGKLRAFRKTAGGRIVRGVLGELARFRAQGGLDSTTALESFLRRLSRLSVLYKERELLNLRQGLSFLAVAGNSSPFIGLFGTVWGIMSAFHDIGLKGSATLATVAPGIAEALIATALGLFAAIPAAVAYNFFTARLERLDVLLEEIGTLTLILVEKELQQEQAAEF